MALLCSLFFLTVTLTWRMITDELGTERKFVRDMGTVSVVRHSPSHISAYFFGGYCPGGVKADDDFYELRFNNVHFLDWDWKDKCDDNDNNDDPMEICSTTSTTLTTTTTTTSTFTTSMVPTPSVPFVAAPTPATALQALGGGGGAVAAASSNGTPAAPTLYFKKHRSRKDSEGDDK